MCESSGGKITKQRLHQYIYLYFETENQRARFAERLARMKSAECFPSAPEGEGGGSGQPNPNRMQDAIVRRLAYEEKMFAKIESMEAEMEEIEEAIDRLRNPLEREVLRLRYTKINAGNKHTPWAVVAKKIYGNDEEKDVLATHRLHGRALVSISKIKTRE